MSCKRPYLLFPNFVPRPLPLPPGWYSYQAYSTSDWYGPVGVYGFFLVSSILNKCLVSKVSSWVYREEKAEGEFRFAHASVRTQVEKTVNCIYDLTLWVFFDRHDDQSVSRCSRSKVGLFHAFGCVRLSLWAYEGVRLSHSHVLSFNLAKKPI